MVLNIYEILAFTAAVCLAVSTFFLVRLLIQVTSTSKELDKLIKNADYNLKKTQSAFELVDSISHLINSTWLKVFGLGFTLTKAVKNKKRKEYEDDDSEQE